MIRTKHVPQRTCVGCRTTGGKRQFVRVVRTPEGTVAPDPSGKLDGRGAYLCERAECWAEALRRDRLGRALRTSVSEADQRELRRYAERFAAVGSTA